MNIQLSDHFTYPRLLRFVLPSIVMMIFTSIYGVVDGLFVSNFVGKTPFAAVNLIMPFLMLFGALGFMLGAGGSAIVAKHLGEGERERAVSVFSMLTCVTVGCGILLTIVGLFAIRPVAVLLGATGEMLEYCVSYGRIILLAMSAFMLQNLFQSFLVTAERPQFGLYVTVAAGVTNIVLDFLFIAVFSWGVVGAAAATAISQAVGGLVPLVYFLHPKNKSLLRLRKPTFDGHALLHACTNGSSELMTNLSLSLANMLYNYQLMRMVGEDGIAAFGVVMYVSFIFITVFIGYSIGSAPIISYHYGAKNCEELKGLFRKSLVLMSVFGAAMVTLAVLLAKPFSSFFVGYDEELLALTTRGFILYSLSYLVLGVNIFASSFFTALGNGGVSAILSFLRLFVFQVVTLLVFPIFLGVDGIWSSIIGSEILALGMSTYFFLGQRKKYGY
ncbi:MAG: MATE family efflux transporter [Clostridia bacterium]|nr:MATE family efflux transporter [Clostridia bacterium]